MNLVNMYLKAKMMWQFMLLKNILLIVSKINMKMGGYILYDGEKYYYTIEERIKSSTHVGLRPDKNLYGYKVVGYWHTHPFGDKKYLSEAFSRADIATLYKANWSDAYVGTYGGKILHYNINISNSIPYENQLYETYNSLIVVEHTEVVGYWR